VRLTRTLRNSSRLGWAKLNTRYWKSIWRVFSKCKDYPKILDTVTKNRISNTYPGASLPTAAKPYRKGSPCLHFKASLLIPPSLTM